MVMVVMVSCRDGVIAGWSDCGDSGDDDGGDCDEVHGR